MFKIKMAGLTIQIQNRYSYVRRLCENYITETDGADMTISVSEEEIFAQMAEDSGSSPGYCESLCIYRNICLWLPCFEGFLIHGAAVAVDGAAYLFLAKSGVGKTTHIRLWMDAFGDRVSVVNGDKPILRRFDGTWHVCGTPWCGKENLGTNTVVPLKALCFLERGQENTIVRCTAEQVTARIFHQLLMPRKENAIDAFFLLLEDILQQIPCYLLSCNQEVSSAVLAYRAMCPLPLY